MGESQDHPYALWRVFHNAPRWWFARGCPPPLKHENTWLRLGRMGVLAGAMGGVTGVVTVALMCVIAVVWSNGATTRGVAGAYALVGCVFGILVLVPLSRWMGRAWWSTLLAVPVAGATFLLPVIPMVGWFDISFTESIVEDWILVHVAMGLVFAIWMGAISRRPCGIALVAGPLVGVLALATLAAMSWAQMELSQRGRMPSDEYFWIVVGGPAFVCYFTLFAIGAGLPLVWCKECIADHAPQEESS